MNMNTETTNSSIFDKVASAPAVTEQTQQNASLFDKVVNSDKYEAEYRRNEAEGVFDFVRSNHQDDEAEALVNLTDFISKTYNISRENAYNNMDIYIKDYMGKATPKKEAWQQIKDGYTEGRITDKTGRLYDKLRVTKDENEKKRLQLEIDKLEAQMPNREGNATTGLVTYLESANNLLGTMVRPLITSAAVSALFPQSMLLTVFSGMGKAAPLIANIGAKALQTGVVFNETRKVETGLIYKDMIENGVPHEIANRNATVHGIIAGALETASIEVLLARFPFMKKAAQGAFMRLAARERMTQGAVKALGKIAADNALSIPISVISETTTEALQELSSIYFERRADLQGIDDKELGKVLADREGEWEHYFDEEIKKQKQDYYVSDEYIQECKDRVWDVVKQTAKGMLVFGMLGAGANTVSDVMTNRKQTGNYRKASEEFEKRKDTVDKAVETERKAKEEWQANPTPENEKAYTEAKEARDTAEKEANLTEEQKEFNELVNTSFERELTTDEIDRIQELDNILQVKKDTRPQAGYEEWLITPEGIEHEAPQTVDVGEQKFREIVKQYTPNVTEAETDELINLMNARARFAGVSLDNYMTTIFQDDMAQLHDYGETIDDNGNPVQVTRQAKGAVTFAQDGRAIIHLTPQADFSTWVHEVGHIFRRQLSGQLLADAESYYGVKDGRWTVEAEERFTEDLTTYLMTRKAPTSSLERVFRIIADALHNIYDRFSQRGEVSDDIARVFDQMFADPESAYAETAVFSPNQIKSATDNFSEQNPSILFQTDTEYLDAVNAGDMAKAQAMVDARAREMGYNSPKLYHGTKQFGFTTVDVSKSDDQVSFFATDRLETAETYSGEETATSIGKRKQISEIKEEINQNADKMLDLLKKIAPKKFGRFTISDIANEIISNIEWENFNSIGFDPFFGLSKLYELFNMAVSDNENLSKLSVGDLDQTQEYKTYSKIFDDIAKVLTESAGNYSLYAKTDKFLKIDAKGANWNKIILPKNIQNRLKKYQVPNWEYYQKGVYKVQVNTRELSYFARQLGYRGVEIKNVVDNGGRGNKYNGYLQLPPATVYIFFDPQSQVKSADPVTYDDNGNVIPLSERFNPQHTHQNLLFQSAYHGSGASFDKFDTDFMGTGEGAQAFGWGIYLSKSKTIAKDYAERRGYERYKEWDEDEWTPANQLPIENKIYRVMRHQPDTYGMTFDEARKYLIDIDEKVLDTYKGKDINALEGVEKEVYEETKEELERLKNAKESNITVASNLYTVSIPDDTGSNYLYWDKNYKGKEKEAIRERIEAQFDKEGLSWQPKYKAVRWNSEMNYKRGTDGRDIYELIKDVFKHEESLKGKFGWSMRDYAQQASEFLNHAGFVGIDYPANSMSGGNRYGKRNFVIFNANDITIDNHLLFQENEEIYQQATEQGQYVPDEILQKYAGHEWADTEIQAREDYRRDAQTYDTFEQFLSFEQGFDFANRSNEYYEEVYNSAQTAQAAEGIQTRDEANRQFLESMTRERMEQIFNIIAKTDEFHNNQIPVPHLLVERTLRGMMKGDKAISVGNYNKIMALMKDDPDSFREFIALAFNDQEEYELIKRQKELYPANEMEKLRAANRQLRQDAAKAKQTLKEADRKVADLQDTIHWINTRFNKYKDKTSRELATLKEDKEALRAAAQLVKYETWQKAQEQMDVQKIKAGMKLDETKERRQGKLADQKAYYKAKIAELRQAQKDRAYYQRLVRIIFRKPPQMCDITTAHKILAIQAQYSPSSMLEKTRARLELEMMNTTDKRKKGAIQLRLNKQSLRDMTLKQIAQIAETVAELRREGVERRMNQLLEIRERRLDTIASLKSDLGKTDSLDKTGSIESKNNNGSLYNRFVSFWSDIHRMTDHMGKYWQEWLGVIKEAHEDELRNVDRRRTAFNDKMAALKLDAKILSKVEEIDGKTYTHDILMSWYIYTQNEDSLAALLFGNFEGNPEDDVLMNRIYKTLDEGISRLTPEERALADWMIESFGGDDWVRLSDTVRIVENRSPEKVDRYFPMMRILDRTMDAQEEPLVDLGERSAGGGRAAVKKNFTLERIHNINWQYQKPLQLGAISTYMKAIQNQEHYIAFAQMSKDMKYVYADVAEEVTAKYGKSWSDNMRAWIDRVINPNAYNSFYNQQTMYSKIISNSVVGALAGNVLSYLKQFPSVMFYLPYCSSGSLFTSMFRYVTDFKAMTEFAKSRSPYLKNRNIDDVLNMVQQRLNDPNSRYRALTEISAAMMKPFSWFDEFACVIGWNAVYIHEMEHGATEKAAINKANEALLKTQPQADALFSPNAYSKPLFRTVLLFTRQANQVTQMITSDFKNNLTSDKETGEKLKYFYRLVFCVALNALLMGWAGRKFAGYGDDDDSAAEDVTREIVSNAAYNFPIVGPAVANAIQRKSYTSGGYVDPISQVINSASNFTNASIKDGELNYDKAVRLITDAMGTAGLPKVLSWRAYRALKEEDIWYLFIGSQLGGNNGSK